MSKHRSSDIGQFNNVHLGSHCQNELHRGFTPHGTQSELHDLPQRECFPSTVFHHDVGETESEQEHAKRQH